MRTWTSTSGSRVEAQFVRQTGYIVVLRNAEGKEFRIQLNNLSDTDRAYIKQAREPARAPLIPSEPVDTKEFELLTEPGGKGSEIKCLDEPEWSYWLYLPPAYHTGRKWPIMYIMSPIGGQQGAIRRYGEGADLNGFILAISVQSRNGFSKSYEAVTAMVKDTIRRLAVDEHRLYASGMSGGARVAFWLADSWAGEDFAGILPCGAGSTRTIDKLDRDTSLFGWCGSNCFNRWDMTITFDKARNDYKQLRFFVGDHAWAPRDLIGRGMSWLNGVFLEQHRDDPRFASEREAYGQMIQGRIADALTTDPEVAYEWARILLTAHPSSTSHSAVAEVMKKLKARPEIALYEEGLEDMADFADEHFNTSSGDYNDNNGTRAAKNDAEKRAKKYASTGLAEIFLRLGEPSVMP